MDSNGNDNKEKSFWDSYRDSHQDDMHEHRSSKENLIREKLGLPMTSFSNEPKRNKQEQKEYIEKKRQILNYVLKKLNISKHDDQE